MDQIQLYFLKRLRSFDVRGLLLRSFYESVVSDAIFYAVVCWGSSITVKDTIRLNKIIRKARSVLGAKVDAVETVVERRMMTKMSVIMKNASHPLHKTLKAQMSTKNSRLLHSCYREEYFRRSFLSAASRL